MPPIITFPEIFAVPVTANVAFGAVLPIPTLPEESILIRSIRELAFPVKNVILCGATPLLTEPSTAIFTAAVALTAAPSYTAPIRVKVSSPLFGAVGFSNVPLVLVALNTPRCEALVPATTKANPGEVFPADITKVSVVKRELFGTPDVYAICNGTDGLLVPMPTLPLETK